MPAGESKTGGPARSLAKCTDPPAAGGLSVRTTEYAGPTVSRNKRERQQAAPFFVCEFATNRADGIAGR